MNYSANVTATKHTRVQTSALSENIVYIAQMVMSSYIYIFIHHKW